MSEKFEGGFTSLASLKKGPSDPEAAIAEIRRIYFKTTKRTIQHDFAHAVQLLTSIPTEEQREKARVYMDGLAQLRREWGGRTERSRSGRRGKVGGK